MTPLIKKYNLAIFSLFGLIYIYLEAMDYNEIIINIGTPIIVGLLFIFYITAVKRKINYLYILVLLLQLIGGMIITKQGNNNFLIGFSIFFIVNILLILIVTNKLGIINPNDVYTKYAPFTLVFLIIVYAIFTKIGVYTVLFLIFGFLAAIFASIAYHYYSKTIKKSASWILWGALAYLICDVFTGLYFLVSKNIYYDIADSIFYLVAIYCINYAMILDASEEKAL